MIIYAKMENLIKFKKSQTPLAETVIFVILNVIFLGIMVTSIAIAGTQAYIVEKTYARSIALAIDNLKPGTEFESFMPDLFDAAEKNKFTGKIVDINYLEGIVTVRVSNHEGQSFRFFTQLKDGSFGIDTSKKIITIKT